MELVCSTDKLQKRSIHLYSFQIVFFCKIVLKNILLSKKNLDEGIWCRLWVEISGQIILDF